MRRIIFVLFIFCAISVYAQAEDNKIIGSNQDIKSDKNYQTVSKTDVSETEDLKSSVIDKEMEKKYKDLIDKLEKIANTDIDSDTPKYMLGTKGKQIYKPAMLFIQWKLNLNKFRQN